MKCIHTLLALIIINFQFFLHASGDTKDSHIPVEILLSEPSCFVNGCVNVITGTYNEFETDIEVAGPHPLTFQRSYISGGGGKMAKGWDTNHSGEAYEISLYDMTVMGNYGSKTRYETSFSRKRKSRVYSVDPRTFQSYITNCPDYFLSAGSHLRNNRLEFRKADTQLALSTANGYWRHYKKVNKSRYKLDLEKQPNGCWLRYIEGSEDTILLRNPGESINLSSLVITDSKNKHLKTVYGSDGKSVQYHFKTRGNGECLTRVVGSHLPMQTYEYDNCAFYETAKITKKILPEGRFQAIEYYKNDISYVDDKDPWGNKVSSLKSPVGVGGGAVETHRFSYYQRQEHDENLNAIYLGGCTTVLDALSNKTEYHFNDDFRLTQINRWDGNQICSIERSFWAPNVGSNSTNLMARTLANAQGEVKICRSYVYDDHGNAIQKKVWGNLSGKFSPHFITDVNGIPYPGQAECHTNYYTYGFDTQTHLLSENDGKKIIEYTYLPHTNLITSRLIKENGRIIKREFNSYDSNGCLQQVAVDDGDTPYEENFSNVTERRLTCIHNRTEAPIGLPEVVDQKYVDLETGEHVLLGRVINHYSLQGQLLVQQHYDSNYVHQFTLEWAYDSMGNKTMEKDALGRVINRRYDQNKNLIWEQGLEVTKDYTYDFANRLIAVRETHSDGTILTNSFKYDYLGNRISSTDVYGQETRYVYDGQQRLIKTIYPPVFNENMQLVQPVSTIDYDLFNNPCRMTDACGGVSTVSYTAHNKPYLKEYPDGTFETFEYDGAGSLLWIKARNGSRIGHQHDALDRLTIKNLYSKEMKVIQSEHCVYNAFHLLSKTDLDGSTTNYTYDKAGRLISVTKDKMRTDYAYDSMGRESKIFTYYGAAETDYTVACKEYDVVGRVIEERVEDSFGRIQTRQVYEYDAFGNRHSVCKFNQAGESITRSDYNSRGQIVTITNPNGEQVHIRHRYDYYDEVFKNLPCTETTDAKGIVTICIKDALGRTKTEIKKDPYGKLIQRRHYYHTAAGQLSRTVDDVIIGGQVQREVVNLCTYNSAGQLTETYESAGTPDQKITKFSYNSYGQKSAETKPDGTLLYYEYDDAGLLKQYWASDNSFHYVYEYNLSSHPVRIIDKVNGVETRKFYDGNHHLSKEILSNGLTIEYIYDYAEKLIETIFPDGSGMKLNYEGILLREVSRVGGKKSYVHSYDEYDLSGNLTQCTLIEKTGKLHYTIDLKGRMAGVVCDAWSGSVLNYDENGNVTEKTTTDSLGSVSSEFHYDELNQLIEEAGVFNEKYAVDSLYNRYRKGDSDYTLNALNQVTHDGKYTYGYDLNGNLIDIKGENTQVKLSYDALNRLVKVAKDGLEVFYRYDEMNRRMEKTLSKRDSNYKKSFKYFYQDNNEIGCCEDGKITELRLLGIGKGAEIGAAIAMELNDTVYAPIHDLHGNVISLVDAETGKVKECYRYSVFGEESLYDGSGNKLETALNPWRFSSKRTDSETGYVYFGRRYYDSNLGRWITPDPIGFEGGPNLYAYVMNNPLTNIDLYGLAAVDSAGSDRSFLSEVRDFFRSAYEGVRDRVTSFCRSVGEGLSKFTSRLCERFSSQNDEIVRFNSRALQSKMNQNQPSTNIFGLGSYAAICLTNGLQTTLDYFKESGELISEYAGGREVIGVHGPTNGNILHDIFRAFHSLFFRMASNVVPELHKNFDAHFTKYGNTRLLVICHSEGAINVRNALMSYDPALRQLIDVVAIAPGAYIDRGLCGSVYHYASTRDFVPLLDFPGRHRCRDTLTVLKAAPGAKFWDHDFRSPTYAGVINFHIQKHLKELREF